MQEYEKNQLDKEIEEQQVCCDENIPCVNNSNNREKLLTNNNLTVRSSQIQMNYQDNVDYLHKGENRHSKNIVEDDKLDIEHLKPDLKEKIKEELEKSNREQKILLKENKQSIIDFIIDNRDCIRIEDLKIYEPVYKC